MAGVIQAVQRPSLIISHNKTLARQLYSEFKALFPRNAVHYFISDYLYFWPQTYRPRTDKYNDKRAALDAVLTHHRLAAATAALARRDTIVVSSVSCIFDIGSPQVCRDLAVDLAVGEATAVEGIIDRLAKLAYRPATDKLDRKTFRCVARMLSFSPCTTTGAPNRDRRWARAAHPGN